jgi:hypothetical protein
MSFLRDDQLPGLYNEWIGSIQDINRRNARLYELEIDVNLKKTQVPSSLSESLAYRGLLFGEIRIDGKVVSILKKGIGCDLEADGKNTAVKGTALKNGWVEIAPEDRNCYCLVWLDFYPLISGEGTFLPATIFFNLNSHFDPPNADKTYKPTYNGLLSRYKVDNQYEYIASITFPGVTTSISTRHERDKIEFSKSLLGKHC